MSELKPCPLCGSEVRWVSGSIRCSRCGLSYGAPVSKEKVERRWNTRAVESANGLVYIPSFRDNGEFPEHIWASLGGESVAYFRERTCHIVKASRKYVMSDGTELFEDGCSECNGYLSDDDNYCSNCGARVEEGDGE